MTTYPVKYAPDSPTLQWMMGFKRFIVMKGFTTCWVRPEGPVFVRVPAGFSTDLASIPRAFTWLVPKLGRHVVPAIVHDYCYSARLGIPRLEADNLFRDGMVETGVPAWKRGIMYRAVRMFGGMSWQKRQSRTVRLAGGHKF